MVYDITPFDFLLTRNIKIIKWGCTKHTGVASSIYLLELVAGMFESCRILFPSNLK